ncbi:MAG: DUF4129 domain-containing protein [Thermoplasmata archaeon]
MASFWKRLRGRSAEPVVVERVSMIEVPVLTEVKQRIARGQPAEAVVYGFSRAVEDFSRARQLPIRPEWTYREYLATAMPAPGPEAARRELFERAYALYEPARFGDVPPDPAEFLSVLTSIYADPEIARLYATPAVGPRPSAE